MPLIQYNDNDEEQEIDEKQVLLQLHYFIRNESAVNFVWAAISGVLQSYYDKTSWNSFDANWFILPIMIGGNVALELGLNILPEIHARSIEARLTTHRRHGFKRLLTETTLPSLISGAMLAPFLYYVSPTYTPQTFLLATLGMQIVRQGTMGIVDAYHKMNPSNNGENAPLLHVNDSPLPLPEAPNTSASVAFRITRAVVATATTVGTVAATVYLCSLVDNQQNNTPAEEASLDGALGATIGVLGPVAVTGVCMLGKCLYSFFRQSKESDVHNSEESEPGVQRRNEEDPQIGSPIDIEHADDYDVLQLVSITPDREQPDQVDQNNNSGQRFSWNWPWSIPLFQRRTSVHYTGTYKGWSENMEGEGNLPTPPREDRPCCTFQ
jgi:hypothetical protein